jgi:hypothetical protein
MTPNGLLPSYFKNEASYNGTFSWYFSAVQASMFQGDTPKRPKLSQAKTPETPPKPVLKDGRKD